MRRLLLTAGITLICCAGTGTAVAATGTKAQLIRKADAICRRVNTRAAPFQAQVTKLVSARHPDYRAVGRALAKSAAVEQSGLSQLRALSVPAGDRATVDRIWSELGTVVSASRTIGVAVAQRDIGAVNRATQRKAGAEAVYRRRAKRYGLRYCGS